MKNISWDYIVETAPDLIKDVLEGLKDNSENPAYHPEPSTYDHIKIVTERLIKTGDMDLVMAGFFHDIGKASVSKKSDEGDWNTSPGHEGISCKLVLRYKDWIEEMGANPYVVFEIVKNHDKIKFNALNKKDKEKLERQGVYPKLSTFKDADNMNRKWDLDEQLVNPGKKKNIKYTGDYPNGEWYKKQYDDNGKLIYREWSNGYWIKWKYDENGNQIYWENSSGDWVKWGYDENGNEIYYENSNGELIDNRPATRNQIQEQLQNVKRRELPSDLKSFVSTILGVIEERYNNYPTETYDNDDEFALYIDANDISVSMEWENDASWRDVIILKIERVDEVGRHLEDLYYSDVDLRNKQINDVVKEIKKIISQYLN
jgi:hypothetical protein